MEQELISELEKLKSEFSEDIILLYYNPLEKDSMKIDDPDWIKHYLDLVESQRAIVIIYGPGGNLNSGILIAHIFRKKLDLYTCFVPFTSCSALNYILLKSDKLYLSKNSKITLIDPIIDIEENGVIITDRLIKLIKHSDSNVAELARTQFCRIRDLVFKCLDDKPSLFNYKKDLILTESEQKEQIVDIFLNKESHYSEISYKELKEMNLKVKLLSESSLDEPKIISSSKKIIKYCQQMVEEKKGNFLLTTTSNLIGYEQKILIRNCS